LKNFSIVGLAAPSFFSENSGEQAGKHVSYHYDYIKVRFFPKKTLVIFNMSINHAMPKQPKIVNVTAANINNIPDGSNKKN